ncbi:MAG: rRNA maturation RNase YbeY [Clostridiales bacterium]|jgi:rRNA maturation RNase YbeY|nr:rRNA maturation RNase YbeY [Clostridiales bacterium]
MSKIFIDNRADVAYKKYFHDCEISALVALSYFGKDANISVSFVTEEEIRLLNKNYRGIDSVTDVLSFPAYDSGEFPCGAEIGDIVICISRAEKQAKEQNFWCRSEYEISLLTVHSVLHLFGYDHATDEDEKKMFAIQDTILSRVVHEKAQRFVYRNARPIDLAQFKYHFEHSKATVKEILDILSDYQNSDGGFGHALEADALNPYSSPIQTEAAIEILREISVYEYYDKANTVAKGILDFLSSGECFSGKKWYYAVPENNNYPHAQWWHCSDNYENPSTYNPTASLASFFVSNADNNHPFFKTAERIVAESIEAFMSAPMKDMHELVCYINLFHDLQNLPLYQNADFTNKLKEDIKNIICDNSNIDCWTEYAVTPSFFNIKKNSPLYCDKEIQQIIQQECKFLKETQNSDGSWDVSWKWINYPNEFAVSANWWRSIICIKKLLFLREFGY